MTLMALLASTNGLQALDPNTVITQDPGPIESFMRGFKAYQRGEKAAAVEALRYAAEKGHPGARWKLGRMYADGDGVKEDDYQAFKIFEGIVRDQQDDTAASQNAAYVASSIVALADYLRRGIPDSPVQVNLPQARQLYFHAASYFGDPEAQFELGRMLLNGEGGRTDPRQAARWLKLAAGKGHVGAQALLGYLLFNGEKIAVRPQPVRGLSLLTDALAHASPSDREWIRPLQEEVFGLADETTRKTAMASVEEQQPIVSKN
ncbi:tetratricopeptide repeat protein [Consotaella aegiceratis]|uniref:tetratricopeptide repeat protein n=1 Tax=Consotaella aegiceratis TaxID=3097961 RepID=UPI003D80A237